MTSSTAAASSSALRIVRMSHVPACSRGDGVGHPQVLSLLFIARLKGQGQLGWSGGLVSVLAISTHACRVRAIPQQATGAVNTQKLQCWTSGDQRGWLSSFCGLPAKGLGGFFLLSGPPPPFIQGGCTGKGRRNGTAGCPLLLDRRGCSERRPFAHRGKSGSRWPGGGHCWNPDC